NTTRTDHTERTKKAKKVHSETTDLVSGYPEQNLENPILEIKTKTDEDETTTNVKTNEETCMKMEIVEFNREELLESSVFDIEDPILKNTQPISEILIDKPGPLIVGNNNRDTKEIDKKKAMQPIYIVRQLKDWECKVIKKRIRDKKIEFDNETWHYNMLLEALKNKETLYEIRLILTETYNENMLKLPKRPEDIDKDLKLVLPNAILIKERKHLVLTIRALRKIHRFEKLHESYMDLPCKDLPENPNELIDELKKFFLIKKVTKLQYLREYRRKLLKFYSFEKMPPSYF
ncbi:24633_t:CDS:2, partial [Gigaspora margarita]